MKNLVVFGGAGFIGTNICKLALSRGYRVYAFDSLMRPGVEENLAFLKQLKGFHFIWGDIRNSSDFQNLPEKIDGLINVAANPSIPKSFLNPRHDFECNVIGHLNILDYAREHGGIPLIFASTMKVYTDSINLLPLKENKTRLLLKEKKYRFGFDEKTDIDGVDGFTNSPYGVSKFAADKYSREYAKHYGVPVVINRMSCIYGLYQKGVADQGWLDWFVRAKKYGYPLTIFGSGKQVRDCLFGTDLAELYLLQMEKINQYSGKVFNVGGGPEEGFNTSLLEIIAHLNKNYPGPQLKLTFADWRPSDQRVYISDIRKVKKATGWKPKTDIAKGVQQIWQSLP